MQPTNSNLPSVTKDDQENLNKKMHPTNSNLPSVTKDDQENLNKKMHPSNSNLPSVTIDDKGNLNIALPYKTSVKLYTTRVFQESTVGMVSSIFTTHSKYRRLFKVFILSLCISGFIYHSIIFLNHVLGYPEVLSLALNRSNTYNWPTYTYCSNNLVRRSEFCRLKPELCVEPSDEFCKNFTSYCGANATLIPKETYYHYLPDEFEVEWILKYGSLPNLLNFMYNPEHRHRNRFEEVSGPYLRHDEDLHGLKSCYTIHSAVESNKQPLQKTRRQDKFQFVTEVVRFYVNETEMMDPKAVPGVYFLVHSPFQAENPLNKGIFMQAGRTYKLYVELQDEVLLKAPFESNCMDYEELWEKNNRTGPRTKKMCYEKCRLDSTMLEFQCAESAVHYPHKEKICGNVINSNLTNAILCLKDYTFYKNCLEKCLDECRSSKYTTEYSIQHYISHINQEKEHSHIEVFIYLSNDEVKVLTHSPKYDTVDVISSFGGFMGCWLGVALMDILDIFGSISSVCRYGFMKRL